MRASPEQLHELLQHCIGFARTMLESAADFYPFGASLNRDGKVSTVGGYNGEERPNPQDIYRLLADGFSAGAKNGSVIATALAANVNIPAQYASNSRDGLRVHLETAGYSRFVYLPYRIKREGLFKKKAVAEFDEPFTVEIAPASFAGFSDESR